MYVYRIFMEVKMKIGEKERGNKGESVKRGRGMGEMRRMGIGRDGDKERQRREGMEGRDR